jgi:aspartyl-tRNA(Asn)/glutamyl-tRNA(Gln) amidotransferase subunit C
MSIGRDDVARVAQLAELAVDEAELPGLVAQLERIVEFVERLNDVHDDGDAEAFVAGPAVTPLREDRVVRAQLAHPVSEMAPGFIDGFFVVPVRGSTEADL